MKKETVEVAKDAKTVTQKNLIMAIRHYNGTTLDIVEGTKEYNIKWIATAKQILLPTK